MLEPYSDRPDESGIMRTPEEAWMPLIDDFVRNVSATQGRLNGLQVNRLTTFTTGLANCM
jgi:hypothetical protein